MSESNDNRHCNKIRYGEFTHVSAGKTIHFSASDSQSLSFAHHIVL